MHTARLLVNMILRGGAWGLPTGLIFGGIYSMLVLGSIILLSRLAGAANSQPPPPLFTIYTILLLGIVGSVVGALIGIVSGAIGGLGCFILTRLLFWPLVQARRYRWVMGLAGIFYGVVTTPLAMQIMSQFSIAPPVGGTGQLALFYIVPGLIAGAACLYISQRIAAWYENENVSSPKREMTGTVVSARPLAS